MIMALGHVCKATLNSVMMVIGILKNTSSIGDTTQRGQFKYLPLLDIYWSGGIVWFGCGHNMDLERTLEGHMLKKT